MRLKSIKLAGFKSFVDPTVVNFPGNLCAIVGPNGCGKSNIIDAVRWVMGESSAKQLRGENSTDVIFNGSAGRKPTAIASIELLFDNSDGRIGGEYSAFGEIAVRRQVTRDAQSTYFLNGQRCRRRDILDVFLGTGFGPRSYSIIEQGMISDLVEAKPEELRVYLEEAAGISKYKERRRETENRIRHTRDNLDRLSDLRGELGRQITHLERQAQAAERYQTLFAEAGAKRVELLALRWQQLGQQISTLEQGIRAHEVELERVITEQLHHETESDRERVALAQENERFNAVQGRFYSLGADVARAEQGIESREQRRRELHAELTDIAGRDATAATEHSTEAARLQNEQQAVAQLQPELVRVEADDQVVGLEVTHAESGAVTSRQAFDQAAAALADYQRRVDVAGSRVEHLEQLVMRLDARRMVLEDERIRLDPDAHTGEVATLEERVAVLEQQLRQDREQLDQLTRAIATAVEDVARAESAVDGARSRFQSIASEHASVAAVQQAALGRRDNSALAWLEAHGYANSPRLGESVQVTGGWERALETVLGGALRAVVVDDVADALASVDALDRGDVMLVSGSRPAAPAATAGAVGRRPLLDLVRWQHRLDTLLSGIYVADNLAEAQVVAATLGNGESVVTRDGIWVGADWLRVARGVQVEAGVLERAQLLLRLRADADAAAADLEHAQEQLANARRQQRELEVQRGAMQEKLVDDNRRLGAVRADAGMRRVRLEEVRAQRERVEREHADLIRQIADERQQWDGVRTELHALTRQGDGLLGARVAALQARDAALGAVALTRQRLGDVREALHQLRLRAQAAESRRSAADAAVTRLQGLRNDLATRKERLQQSLVEAEAPLEALQTAREQAMSGRTAVEQLLTASRTQIEQTNVRLRELEERRARSARMVGEERAVLDSDRLNWQDLRTRRGGLADQAAELGASVELVAPKLDPAATVAQWESDLQRVEQRIARLGPINLAAIDEYRSQSERKQYLDEQNDDLDAALTALSNAIREIDGETRVRFSDTFEKVNTRFKELFPKVFGGGSAELELTGDDLLDTGVTLMARPPGKRNSSIHLLSGGEKALIAIALIMSIFHLNPSPVCMLDEVDAPLDDTNVGRFAQLIKEMSGGVQFIFVTHNKIAMEMADQLMGVTMQEPGVSRLVSVDVDKAVAMAAS